MGRWYALAIVGALCLLLVDRGSTFECGKRKAVTTLIVEGEESKPGFWPWHVALFINKRASFRYVCGGSILDQNTILTAAHCVVEGSGTVARERLTVQVGRHRFGVADERMREHEAFELIVHPKYTVSSIDYDIALIKLATYITFTDFIQPICLWDRNVDQSALVNMVGSVVGFGFDETFTVSDTLREARIPVVSTIDCIESNRAVFAQRLTSRMFCAGTRDGVAACNGDSGGGLFFNFSSTWYVRGLVSFTKPQDKNNICDPREYTVFSDVGKYLDWISQYLQKTAGGGQPVTSIVDDDPKLALLPLSTCGPNPYGNRDELNKPVLLGYPWAGLLEYTEAGSREKKTACQATLISDRYVITAAHCIHGLPKRYTLSSVRLGEYDKSNTKDCDYVNGEYTCAPPVQVLRIESVIVHKGFNSPRFANDIALIRLRDRADTSKDNVKPICLPTTNSLRSEKPTHFTLTTWPIGSSNNLLDRSRRMNLDSIACQQQYEEKSINIEKTSHQICIKQEQDSTRCKFPTSAAPLQAIQKVKGQDRYVLHGLLSHGPQSCSALFPDVYTRVGSFIEWILNNIEA